MADAVTSQTIINEPGGTNLTMKFTNLSDGTGESNVTKVDISALDSNYSEVRIDKISYSTSGMAVNILWDATANVLAWTLPADSEGTLDFCKHGGLKNNAGAGKTGDVLFTTVGAGANDAYAIVLHMVKREAV